MIYLAINRTEDRKIGLKEISSDLNIPSPFLGKILQGLAKKRFLLSTKGPNGGFTFREEKLQCTLYDIVEAVDGIEVFTNCLIGLHGCKTSHPHSAPCPVHDEYHKIRVETIEFFKGQTLESIVCKMKDSSEFIQL